MPGVARILVTRELPGDGIERLREDGHDVDLWERDEPMPRDELLARVRDAEGLLSAAS